MKIHPDQRLHGLTCVKLTAGIFLRSEAAFGGLQAGLALSPVLRPVRAELALSPVARVLSWLQESPAARELVGVQDVEHGEGGGPVRRRALGNKTFFNLS